MKVTLGERIFSFTNSVLLGLIGLSTVIPFIYVIFTSFATDKEVLQRGMVLFPSQGFTLDAYHYVLRSGSGIPRAYYITVLITVVGTCMSLILTSAMGYGMSKRNVPGGKVISYAVLFTMLFNGGLIPTYMVVKSLGLINSVGALIFPSLISVWNMMIMISFFQSIPESLEESAKIDGCNDIYIFIKLILPLSLPVLATIGLFYAVAYWNQWFNAVIYINNKKNWPLQLLLRQVLIVLDLNSLGNSVDPASQNPPPGLSIKTATIVITMLPILLIYPAVQKYFIKGVMIGAVKG